MEEGYEKNIAPFTSDRETYEITPVNVSVSIQLEKIIEIAESEHTIEIKFVIIVKWMENRVQYYNLKKEKALNTMSNIEKSRLWIPYIIFQNTDENEAVDIEWITASGNQVATKMFVTRQGSFVRAGEEHIDETEIFQGFENTLTLIQSHTKVFHCTYQLHYFPFDTQVWHSIKHQCFNV